MCNKTKDTARKEESHAEASDSQCRYIRIVWCAVLNMSQALLSQNIARYVQKRCRGRSQTRANAGAGQGTDRYVLNCPQKMTD